jgi:hypothetical protein
MSDEPIDISIDPDALSEGEWPQCPLCGVTGLTTLWTLQRGTRAHMKPPTTCGFASQRFATFHSACQCDVPHRLLEEVGDGTCGDVGGAALVDPQSARPT